MTKPEDLDALDERISHRRRAWKARFGFASTVVIDILDLLDDGARRLLIPVGLVAVTLGLIGVVSPPAVLAIAALGSLRISRGGRGP